MLKTIVGIDFVCLVLGFSRIDHACHLGILLRFRVDKIKQ